VVGRLIENGTRAGLGRTHGRGGYDWLPRPDGSDRSLYGWFAEWGGHADPLADENLVGG